MSARLFLFAGNVVHSDQKRRSKRYLCWARAQMRCVLPREHQTSKTYSTCLLCNHPGP